MDAGVRSASAINKEKERDRERGRVGRRERVRRRFGILWEGRKRRKEKRREERMNEGKKRKKERKEKKEEWKGGGQSSCRRRPEVAGDGRRWSAKAPSPTNGGATLVEMVKMEF